MRTLYYSIDQKEKVNFGYSLKNIPTPNERTYKLQLIEKIELFIKKLRWKAIFFINNSKETTESRASSSAYGLKSNKCPPQLKELIPFEDDLIDLVKNIKFRKVRNDFQKQLHEDLKKVRSSKKTLTFADKTSNMYRLDKEEYRHLLQNAVTTTYKKSNKETERRINCEGIKYAKEANILDKVEVNGTANCFITLKDHKESLFCTKKEIHGLKNKTIISILQWDHTTELRYVNLSVVSY